MLLWLDVFMEATKPKQPKHLPTVSKYQIPALLPIITEVFDRLHGLFDEDKGNQVTIEFTSLHRGFL